MDFKMNKYHEEIIDLFSSYKGNYKSKHDQSYIGSSKFGYPISTPESRKIIKNWLKGHPDLTAKEFTELMDSLSLGKSFNEVTAIGKFLEYCPDLRHSVDPKHLDSWLDHTEGWAEVDTICAGTFSAEDYLSNWSTWEKLIKKFSTDPNVHKRRASLVLLVSPVRQSPDSRLSALAFENIEKLKGEKDILITKAISWLLRHLIKLHRKEVELYLNKNADSLPKIAVRETQNKLKSGRKSEK
jgi:3-methyladenine DNA glycosylase AlkD